MTGTLKPSFPRTMLEVDQIYHADCVSGMGRMTEQSVDLMVTDPPFAIDFKARRGNYNRTASRVLEGFSRPGAF